MITISAEGLPTGVTCPGAVLGGEVTSGELVFVAADSAPAWAGAVKIVGNRVQLGGAVGRRPIAEHSFHTRVKSRRMRRVSRRMV